ncbi:hypothetical protein BD779DRAFT_160837 [Infundibulicybe gibba]|nr:hypothetical protein BD779DRAFT_160837 [Infundibulicybe gibba]
MQPFNLLVPILCAGFAYSAVITVVDFQDESPNTELVNSQAFSVEAGSDGFTTILAIENNIYTDATTTSTSGTVSVATATFVENGSGLHFSFSDSVLDEAVESCSWDSSSAAATCVVAATAAGFTTTDTESLTLRVMDADATDTSAQSGPTQSHSGAASVTQLASGYQWAVTVLVLGSATGALFVL